MAFHVRDPETDRVVRELAALRGTSLTQAIRDACQDELDAIAEARPNAGFAERIKPFQDDFAQFPDTGVATDKAFFDALNDE